MMTNEAQFSRIVYASTRDVGGWDDLSDMDLRVRYRDGSENVFLGVLRYPGEWTHEAVERFCREANATVYVPVEALQEAS